MINSYLRVILRNISKQPIYTVVNLAGLSVGIACAVFIGIFIWDELQYDRHHENADNVYRVSQKIIFEDEESHSATTPFPLKNVLENEFSAYITESARFFDMEAENVSIGNRDRDIYYRESKFYFADPSVLQILDIPLRRGNPETALTDPNTVIITTSAAERYFGSEDPMGKELHFEGRIYLTVTGVMEEWPKHSHIDADIIASFESLSNIWGNYDVITSRWAWNPVWTYVRVEEGTDIGRLQQLIDDFTGDFYRDFLGSNETVEHIFQSLTNIYLFSNLNNEIGPVSSYLYIIVFFIVGLLIIGIACINYINLSTARAVKRSREVGLRKALGADTNQLRNQFLFESSVYAAIAIVLSAVLIIYFFPYFGMITGKEISLSQFGTGTIVSIVVVIQLAITFLAGFYPATFLAGYNPADSVRGSHTRGKKGGKLRRMLVLFQFSVTAVLLIGTSLAYIQYQHMQQMEMGFEQEQVVVLPATNTLAVWRYDEFKNRVANHSAVHELTGTQIILGSDLFLKYQVTPEGYGEDDAYSIAKMFVMHDFLETMGIDLIAGRTFSEDFSTDVDQAVLINKKLVDELQWGSPQDALGRTFRYGDKTVSVIGVTENFHFAHLRYDMEPLIMELPDNRNQLVANIGYVKVRLAKGSPSGALTHIQSVWDDMESLYPFEFFFLDSRIDEMYTAEKQFNHLMIIFTILAIIIGCLGLLGLASYTVNSRTKEIAIRKAMGATARGIFYMLSKDYVKLILFAHLIALPIVYLIAELGLSYFPYSIDLMNYLVITFFLSLCISLIISLLTISSHTIKAATLNPVDNLKQE